ncbi:hypothetical protein CXB49_15875 [Chromobacterium sp. ATCC 53434]|uniref:hypothetical protein n=1 Tax=Chromobacterium sp. (strain ATCC 53434 / SC 14030) TaxID=2059672 RepID=UPI000C78E3CA|nr:hypothetical protein [Chromobacterium sp. ATCC 53434]AUH52185.1 hypothetical protein CXB49_15875 [Chromobacterium sp. ATCC 53434]
MADLAAALSAYLHLIARLGAVPGVVDERRALLQRLLARLRRERRDADAYHAAVDGFLNDCAADERVLAITCAREFYCFWLDDMQKVVEATARAGFSIHNPAMQVLETLDALLALMRSQRFARFPPSLGLYLGKLFEDGTAEEEIRRRESLLKALLFLLNPHPVSNTSYRMAVDALLLHLPGHDDKQQLRLLVREYFPYWQAFPFAHHRLAGRAGDGEPPADDGA